METEPEKRNEKLKRLDECGYKLTKFLLSPSVPTMSHLMKRRKIDQCLMFLL